MFLYKTISIFSITVLFLLFFSCKNKQAEQTSRIADTTKINTWKKNYDSLYTSYRSSKKNTLLIQAGISADSILNYESTALNDSIYFYAFCDVLFYRAINLNDLGYFVKSQGLFTKYIHLYREKKLTQPKKIAYAQFTVANIYSRYGDYKKAALFLQQASDYYATIKDTDKIASSLLNLSIPLKELRNYSEAEKSLNQIFQLNSASEKRKAKAYIELADIGVRQQNTSEATQQIQKAKQILSDIPNDMAITETYAQLYSIEGNLEMANNNPQKALISYTQSLDSAKKSSAQDLRNREIGKTYIAIGKALEQLHLSDSAVTFYTKALYTVVDVDTLNKFSLPQAKDIYAENTIAEALYARADCIIGRGMQNIAELQNAVSCYQLAFATESKLLNAFSYDESRLYMVGETRKQTEKAIAVCYQLYTKTNEVSWANAAFLFAEHNKAFVLQESVRRNTAAALFLQHDPVYEKMQQLQSNLALTEIALGKQYFSATPDTALLQSLTTAKQKAEEELLLAENNIRIKNPQYNNWLNEEVALPAEDIINKTISGNTAMVEYFTGDAALYVFSAANNKPLHFYKLADSAKNSATDFLHFFANQNLILNNPVQYAAVAHTLYQSILAPCLPEECTSLLIIPDGFTAYIPFDALITDTTASTNIAAFSFLIKQQQIYYAFSCKTLLAQSQIKSSTTDNSLVAFAPVFANKERGLSSLLHSNEELDAIKQWYPQGKFFSGNNATLKEFENNCSNASIIHLATHASPGNDSLPARFELFDSSIYINSIYAKKINAVLVVLSGCETGTGALNKSEGLMSLARGFSYAGTKNVIASLWQTEDNSASAIFKNFYSNLATVNFSAALRKAKLDFLNNASVSAASPYYWSGYIYIGAPNESLPAPSFNKLKWLAALTSLALITAYFIFIRRRRQQSIR